MLRTEAIVHLVAVAWQPQTMRDVLAFESRVLGQTDVFPKDPIDNDPIEAFHQPTIALPFQRNGEINQRLIESVKGNEDDHHRRSLRLRSPHL